MKSAFYPKSISLVRKLKPKLTQPNSALLIQNISFSDDQDGQTFIKIYPSQISISSRDLIEMIETKKESIQLKNNACVLREDILLAIHNFPCEEDIQRREDNQNLNTPNTTPPNEPKRPTNAFILYRGALQKKIKTLFPSFNNSDISKFIGAMWKAADKEVKQKYIKQAMECRMIHKQKYPNFEYNIKKENVNNETPNSKQYSILSDNWDSCFDWYLQNATADTVRNGVDAGNDSRYTAVPYTWNNFDSSFSTDLLNPESLQIPVYQESEEWREVCNIVAEFFPEDSDQNTLIDDKLWTSLGGIDLIKNSDFGIMCYFDDNVPGRTEEQR
jgi:hypothetical protein